MKQQQLNDELTIIGLIFTILVLAPLIYFNFTGLKQELYLAKSLVVELDEESSLAYEMVESLNNELDISNEYSKFTKLLKDLSQIKQNKDLTLVVCFTESSFRYNAKHTGWYNEGITGHMCGLKDHWVDIIPELNQDNINTLYAGSLVISYLLDKHNNDLFKAIKEFKGANKNLTTTYKTIRLYNKIKQN